MTTRPTISATTTAATFSSSTSVHSGVLQRKCACGNHTTAGGECAECGRRKDNLQCKANVQRALDYGLSSSRIPVIQRKLAIGASNDPLEQEADRVADQVMATSTHPAVGGSPLRIQRYAEQSTGQIDTAPASVDRVLASLGRPLEPQLQQDMEQRFGHDFSRVRVHSGDAAEQSARDVNANAYTVGNHVVFGAGRFAPSTKDGRRLLAHELTHVLQQSSAESSRHHQDDDMSGLSAKHVQITGSREPVVQRDESDDERRRKRIFDDLPVSSEVAASWGMRRPPSAIPKSNAASVMDISKSHVSPIGLGPKPGPRTLEEVIAASNVDPHRHKPARETPAPGDEEVMKMTGLERLSRAVDYAKETFHNDVNAEIDALFTKQAIAGMAAFAALYIAAQLTPAGWVADAFALTALTISAIFVGTLLFQIMKDLGVFVSAVNARTIQQLKDSGAALARALAKAGVALIVALLTRTIKGAVKPYDGPPPPGVVDAVTPEGLIIRVPEAAIPRPGSSTVNLASKAVGVPPPTKTVKPTSDKGAGDESPKPDKPAKEAAQAQTNSDVIVPGPSRPPALLGRGVQNVPKTKTDADVAAKIAGEKWVKKGGQIKKFENSPHSHHLFPEDARLQKHWDRLGINNQDPKYKVWLNPKEHLKGVHGGHSDPGGLWNATWLEFFDKNPNATVAEVLGELARMRKSFGI